jgi:large subunit ribosomal protein L23
MGEKGVNSKGLGRAGLRDYQVILETVVTEKAAMAEGLVFRVHQDASKCQIKAAIERIFKVKVVRVNTCNYMGKPKRAMRSTGRRAGYRKAYVTLKEGERADIIEGL